MMQTKRKQYTHSGNVRLADIAFFNDKPGEAAAVTMDGDVWLISGLFR